MNSCHCLCALHRAFSTIECTGRPDVDVSISALYSPSWTVSMCTSCAGWWKDSDPITAARDLQVTWADIVENPPVPYFSPSALYDALMKERDHRGIKSMREVCRQAGVAAQALLHLRAGRCPDATRLVRLLLWLDQTDVSAFVRYEEPA